MSGYTNVGMDVHARSVACKALRPETGECWSNTFSGEGYGHDLLAWLKGLPGPVRCAYESGCTGFWLCRFLGREGVECEVMAVSTLPRSPKGRRHEDDRHDAGVFGKTFFDTLACRISTLRHRSQLTLLPDAGR